MTAINIIGIIILIIGIILIGLELYIPGFGLPGISGIICTIAGVFMTGRNTTERIIMGIVAAIVISLVVIVSILLFNSGKLKMPLRLDTDLSGKDNFIEEKDMAYLIGKKGISISDLRPSGKGEFDGVKFDVIAKGEFITKGSKLIITEIKNNNLIVKEDK